MRAAGAILQYLNETQPAALQAADRPEHLFSLSEFMVLDAATRRNLELTETMRGGTVKGSLLGVLDHTRHADGQAPAAPVGQQAAAGCGADPGRGRRAWRSSSRTGCCGRSCARRLKPLGDLERLVNRVLGGQRPAARPGGDARDAAAAAGAAGAAAGRSRRRWKPVLAISSPAATSWSLLEAALADDPPATLQNIGVIRPGYSAELDGVVERSRHAREWIANLEAVRARAHRDQVAQGGLQQGLRLLHRDHPRQQPSWSPAEYIRKQTLVNAERYITPEMKEYETLVLNAEERIREIEARLFREVCAAAGGSASRLLSTARALAQLDVLAALAEAAALDGYVRPEVVAEDVLEIRDGRHPVVEQMLSGERFVPNDVIFEAGRARPHHHRAEHVRASRTLSCARWR